jgi:hypothetical protein
MIVRHNSTRRLLIASISAVLLCLFVALPSIATCCPPQSGDDVARDAAVHRCCTAACLLQKAAKNADAGRVSLLPPHRTFAFFAVVSAFPPSAAPLGAAMSIAPLPALDASPRRVPLRI